VLKAIIFDVDGTLVHSVRCSEASLIEPFAEHGVTVKNVDFTPFIGACEKLAIESIAAEHGLSLDPDAALARKNQHYHRLSAEMIEIIPGTHAFMQRCREQGLQLALASSATTRRLEINLEVLELKRGDFASVLSGEDVEKRKPDPELFLTSARNMNVEPRECLVVEDALTGIAAACAAGCPCLALTTSFNAEQLTAADWVAADFANAPPQALSW
jgi:HAD superfamily hydrolase (TIGR01509 family)